MLIRYGNGANQSSSHQPGVVRLEAEVGGVQDGEGVDHVGAQVGVDVAHLETINE